MKKVFCVNITFNSLDGLVARVALALERRGYSINAIKIETSQDRYSEMLLTMTGQEERFEQVCRQLQKLIDVIAVEIVENKEVPVSAFAA